MQSLLFAFFRFARIHPFHSRVPTFSLLLALGLLRAASGNEPTDNSQPAPEEKSLNGTWLAQSAMRDDHGLLGWVWMSRFVVSGNSFDISHVYDASKDIHLRGIFALHGEANP